MDWTRSEITHLIRLYKEYECLWNYEHEDYNNQDAKLNAWLDIASACNKEMDDVKRKVKNLRSAYVSEKKKIEASKDMGVNYRPNLFYYNEFDFLETVVILRKSTLPPSSTFLLSSRTNKNNDKSNHNKHEDIDNVIVNRDRDRDINKKDNRKHKIVKVDRKSLRETKFSNAIDAIVASVKQAPTKAQKNVVVVDEEDSDGNNVFDSFGKTTALHLQQLPMDKATEAMAEIYQLLAKKMLVTLRKSQSSGNPRRTKGVISFDTMSS